MPQSLPYGTLTQHHPEYMGETWQQISDLYAGGFQILERVENYLPKLRAETPEQYAERKREASYIGYMGQIVDYFAASLFSQEITITAAADAENPNTPGEPPDPGYYEELANNCDRKGTKLAKLLRDTFTTAILKKRALVAVDFPATTNASVTRADEEMSGASAAYCLPVEPEQLIDWDYNDSGHFSWAVLHRIAPIKASPYEPREKVREEFKIWIQDAPGPNGEPGKVRWELYAIEYDPKNRTIAKDTVVPLVGEGTTSFKRVPLIELTVPVGLWVGNKIGPMAREHFRRRSTLNAAEARTLFEIPVVHLGSEIGAPGGELPSDAQQDPNRGAFDVRTQCLAKGMTVLGKDDKLEFVGPSGQAYTVVDSQLQALVEEMFRITFQLAASVSMGTAALKRSGESKSEDRRAESIVLTAFGALVRDFAVRLYECIAAARGEDVIWSPHGLEGYESDDRAETLAEAVQVDAVAIPSETFRAHHKISLAFRLLANLPPNTQEQIREEIIAGVRKEQDQAEHMHALAEMVMQEPGGDEEEGGSKPPQRPSASGKAPMPMQPPKGPQRGKGVAGKGS